MRNPENRVFISYRRDDAAGYAGRLEEALEKRLGHGSVFRDALDIAPGEDFVAAIRARLAGAQTVLVLIGPRWAGGDSPGKRRIDDAQDFVRLEVAVALQGGARVVPVLLSGATIPAANTLPDDLQALAQRNAMTLGDAHWNADIERLLTSLAVPTKPARWKWAMAGTVAAAIAALLIGVRPGAKVDAGERLLGTWQAPVRYAWGDRYEERFEFKRHAGEMTGTASFLGYPRAIEQLRVQGTNLHFETHSSESVGATTKQLTHAYAAELRGSPPDEKLAIRLQTSGGYSSNAPLEFDALRVDPATVPPATPTRRP